jgi:hypothetical protein
MYNCYIIISQLLKKSQKLLQRQKHMFISLVIVFETFFYILKEIKTCQKSHEFMPRALILKCIDNGYINTK